MLTIKLIRIRKFEKPFVFLFKRLGVGVDKTRLALTLWSLVMILHVIACLWGVSGTFNLDSNVNWIIADNIQD